MKMHRMVASALIVAALVSLATGCFPMARVSGSDRAPVDLDGTKWDLIELNGQLVTGQGPATLDFLDGSVGGTAFCNSFFASYEQEGTSLSFGQVGSTLMMCVEDVGPEAEYLAGLGTVANARIEDGNLVLSNDDGDAVLVYAPAQDTAFEATTWILTGLLDKGGMTSTVVDDQITAVPEAGALAGSAGCNRYTAQFTVEGNRIELGPAAATKMACMEPEGVMQREQAYLEALGEVARYEISRSSLMLYDGQGRMVLTFVAAGE